LYLTRNKLQHHFQQFFVSEKICQEQLRRALKTVSHQRGAPAMSFRFALSQ